MEYNHDKIVEVSVCLIMSGLIFNIMIFCALLIQLITGGI